MPGATVIAGIEPIPTSFPEKMVIKQRVVTLAMVVLAMPIVCATFISKLAIPPFGSMGIGISLFVLPLATIAGYVSGVLEINAKRFAVFLLMTGILSTLSLLGSEPFSINSMAMLFAVHLPFIFAVKSEMDGKILSAKALDFFLNVSLIIAGCGIAQYFLQYIVDVRFLFPIENFLSPSFVVQHFNAQGVLGYGSQVYRANGVFMLEPSYLAQLLAVALIAELGTLTRWFRLFVYGLALLLAHSGTGLMVIAVCVPILIVSRRRWDLLIQGMVAIVVLMMLKDYLNLGSLLARSGEFTQGGSSGFARFVGGFYLFDQVLWDNPWRTLFGTGAGTFGQFGNHAHYAMAEMPLFKMILEFGLIGASLYFLCLAYLLFSSPASKILGLAIALTFLLNGIYIVFSQALAFGLLVWPFRGAGLERSSMNKYSFAARSESAILHGAGRAS